jgi:hypothetical protein
MAFTAGARWEPSSRETLRTTSPLQQPSIEALERYTAALIRVGRASVVAIGFK